MLRSSFFLFLLYVLFCCSMLKSLLCVLYLMSASLEFSVTRLSSFMFWWHLPARDKLMTYPGSQPIRDENRGQWPIRAQLRPDIVTSPGTHSTVLRAYVRDYEENCGDIPKQVCPLIFRFLSVKHNLLSLRPRNAGAEQKSLGSGVKFFMRRIHPHAALPGFAWTSLL